MTVRILKKGVGTTPVYYGTCKHYQCEFEFKHEDAINYIDDQVYGISYQLVCPLCDHRIWVGRQVLRRE